MYNNRIPFFLLLTIVIWTVTIPVKAQTSTDIGGYGSIHYNEVTTGMPKKDRVGTLDFRRFVISINHKFNYWLDFYSETDLQHALVGGNNNNGTLNLEQAYLDFKIRSYFNIRTGLILVPVGLINVNHNPVMFNGVERPEVEQYIIPSTWRELGGGFYGSFGTGFYYQIYGFAGLDPSGLSGQYGIRNSRQNGTNVSTDNWAVATRLDYDIADDFRIGVSYYYSTLSNSATVGGNQLEGANLHLADIHAVFTPGNWQFRGLYALSHIEKARDINLYYNKYIGATQYGAYIEAGYNILGLIDPDTWQELIPFARYEKYDTNYRTGGYAHNNAYNRYETTFGFTYKPIRNIAIKADYQLLYNYHDAHLRRLNLGVAYSF